MISILSSSRGCNRPTRWFWLWAHNAHFTIAGLRSLRTTFSRMRSILLLLNSAANVQLFACIFAWVRQRGISHATSAPSISLFLSSVAYVQPNFVYYLFRFFSVPKLTFSHISCAIEFTTRTNKLTPNGNTQSDMFYLCLHWLLALLLFL